MGRAPCCDKANVKKGPWSPEEDAKLKSYIEQHGTGGNWIALPQKMGLKRCGKSCRLRWLNYLRPNIKHGGFSEEEDRIICSLYVSIGSRKELNNPNDRRDDGRRRRRHRWSIIAAQLPGRTDNDIKNYWNTRLKKKLFGNKQRDNQVQLTRRGRKIKNHTGKNNSIVLDLDHDYEFHNHNHNQSIYWPDFASAVVVTSNSPVPYASFDQEVFQSNTTHHQQVYGQQQQQQQSSCFNFNFNHIVSFGNVVSRADQFAPDGVGVARGFGGVGVGEFENLVCDDNRQAAFDSEMQFLFGEDQDHSNGVISDCDWGEISSLISSSSSLYP